MYSLLAVLAIALIVIYVVETYWTILAVIAIIGVIIFCLYFFDKDKKENNTLSGDNVSYKEEHKAPQSSVSTPPRTVAEENALNRKKRITSIQNGSDVTKGYQWLATLDGNTCFFCANLDGKEWDLTKSPIKGNPYQMPQQACPNCRCTYTPILKTWKELGFDEFEDFGESTRASMNGPVPGNWNFEEWFKHQTTDFQKQYLGSSRYSLWANGKIIFADLVSRDGRVRTLAEMGFPDLPEDAPQTAYHGYLRTVKLSQPKIFKPVGDVEFPTIATSEWHIILSFGHSRSSNLDRALALAHTADTFSESEYNSKAIYQATFTAKRKSFLKYLKLYDIVGNWKSSTVFVNDKAVDRKIIGRVNYCYGDCCRSGNKSFCYGASFMTKNPFGCHRLQISAHNNPWHSFYKRAENGTFRLDRKSMKNQIDNYALIYSICPVFSYEQIMSVFHSFPDIIGEGDYFDYCNNESSLPDSIKKLEDLSRVAYIMK